MQNILNLSKTNKLILATFAFLAVMAFGSGRTHAATLNITGGCTLPIATNSVNAGANQSGCTATVSPDGYGTNDTINIPVGTQTLTADLPTIIGDVTVQGAGMGQSAVSGDGGQYMGFDASSTSTVTFKNLTVTGYNRFAIRANGDLTLENIEVDGADAVSSSELFGIFASSQDGNDHTVTSSNVYIHGLSHSGNSYMHAFVVATSSGGHTTATITNTTLADIHATGSAGVNGIDMHVGTFGGTQQGTLDVNISNTTINDITSLALTAPFNGASFADSGATTVNAVINNITITNTHGADGTGPLAGVNSAAFYAATSAYGASDVGAVNMTVSNSLMADNTSSGIPSNCAEGEFNAVFSGSGSSVPTITSAGHNISDDDSCTGFNQPSDQQNVGNIVSTLGPLQDNGGSVPTRALLPGSPAISAGGAVLGVTTDARGVARPNTCPSVGAFQFEGAVCAATTTNANAGGAAAPNTGAKTASTLMAVIASVLGLSILGYAVKKRA